MSENQNIYWNKFENALKLLIFKTQKVLNDFYNDNNYPTTERFAWLGNGGALTGKEIELNEHFLAVWNAEKEIESLHEYQTLINTVSNDTNLNNLLNGYEITNNSFHQIDLREYIKSILSEYFTHLELSKLNEDEFFRYFFVELKNILTATEFEVTFVAHLQGFLSDIDEININNRIKLKKLSLVESNDLYGDESFYVNSNYIRYMHVLTSKCTYYRKFQKNNPDGHIATFPEKDILSGFDETLDILRIYKSGYINIDRILNYRVKWDSIYLMSGSIKSTETLIDKEYYISKNEMVDLETFFDNYKSLFQSTNKKFINSFKWLSNSSTKTNIDDRFLDYMIVLEALYLENRAELAFLLALRIAYYLEDEYLKRNYLFELIKKAYRIRGDMVHQGISLPEQVETNNRKLSGKKFVDEISNVVYRTIKKIILNSKQKFPVNADEWNKIILSG